MNQIIFTDYLFYGFLYATTILCNKFVLSSLKFQYPTIFQSWQTFIGMVLMWMVSDFNLWGIVLREVLPWLPAMMMYVGTIYSGSIALSNLPIPVFIVCQSCSDVMLLLCNQSMPSNLTLLSMPFKLAAGLVALFSMYTFTSSENLFWMIAHTVLSGGYRTVAYWYSMPTWPFSSLTTPQRQFLNYSFSTCILLPLIYISGHHEQALHKFEHFYASKFYIGCVMSALLGWAVNRRWNKFSIKGSSSSSILMVQLFAKILTVLFSINLFPVFPNWQLWLSIFLCISGDLFHIVGMMLEKDDVHVTHSEEIHDVLIGS